MRRSPRHDPRADRPGVSPPRCACRRRSGPGRAVIAAAGRGPSPEGRMLDLPGRGRTFVVDVPGPDARRADGGAAARARLHGVPLLGRALGELSRTHRVVTFDQRWHGRGIRSAAVPLRRLRRRRRGGDGRAGHRPGDRRRLLDGRRGRPADVAPAPGAGRRPGARARPRATSAATTRERFFFPLMTAGDEPAVPGRRSPRSSGSPRRCRRCRRRRPRPGRAGAQASSAAPAPGRCPRCSASWAGSTRRRGSAASTSRPRSSSPPRDNAIPASASARSPPPSRAPRCSRHPGGHASVVMDHAGWFPVFLEAVANVSGGLR